MRRASRLGLLRMVACGAILLQAGACNINFAGLNESLQTVFLGITAAGSIAILQNI